ncbi:unnamed protein product [Gordionus sp. m RMFG-2023]|uniref:uncharacterized protein LOC135924134 n=1 Tax=Gordionus sp. m RMFG-2023 TaxID=3053472 RepID=UPI0030E3AB1B
MSYPLRNKTKITAFALPYDNDKKMLKKLTKTNKISKPQHICTECYEFFYSDIDFDQHLPKCHLKYIKNVRISENVYSGHLHKIQNNKECFLESIGLISIKNSHNHRNDILPNIQNFDKILPKSKLNSKSTIGFKELNNSNHIYTTNILQIDQNTNCFDTNKNINVGNNLPYNILDPVDSFINDNKNAIIFNTDFKYDNLLSLFPHSPIWLKQPESQNINKNPNANNSDKLHLLCLINMIKEPRFLLNSYLTALLHFQKFDKYLKFYEVLDLYSNAHQLFKHLLKAPEQKIVKQLFSTLKMIHKMKQPLLHLNCARYEKYCEKYYYDMPDVNKDSEPQSVPFNQTLLNPQQTFNNQNNHKRNTNFLTNTNSYNNNILKMVNLYNRYSHIYSQGKPTNPTLLRSITNFYDYYLTKKVPVKPLPLSTPIILPHDQMPSNISTNSGKLNTPQSYAYKFCYNPFTYDCLSKNAFPSHPEIGERSASYTLKFLAHLHKRLDPEVCLTKLSAESFCLNARDRIYLRKMENKYSSKFDTIHKSNSQFQSTIIPLIKESIHSIVVKTSLEYWDYYNSEYYSSHSDTTLFKTNGLHPILNNINSPHHVSICNCCFYTERIYGWCNDHQTPTSLCCHKPASLISNSRNINSSMGRRAFPKDKVHAERRISSRISNQSPNNIILHNRRSSKTISPPSFKPLNRSPSLAIKKKYSKPTFNKIKPKIKLIRLSPKTTALHTLPTPTPKIMSVHHEQLPMVKLPVDPNPKMLIDLTMEEDEEEDIKIISPPEKRFDVRDYLPICDNTPLIELTTLKSKRTYLSNAKNRTKFCDPLLGDNLVKRKEKQDEKDIPVNRRNNSVITTAKEMNDLSVAGKIPHVTSDNFVPSTNAKFPQKSRKVLNGVIPTSKPSPSNLNGLSNHHDIRDTESEPIPNRDIGIDRGSHPTETHDNPPDQILVLFCHLCSYKETFYSPDIVQEKISNHCFSYHKNVLIDVVLSQKKGAGTDREVMLVECHPSSSLS